jgi:hypothetical protein
MRIFCILLSIYFLTLSALPCTDEQVGAEKQDTELTVAGHTSHDHEQETCSPFCICACCGVSVFLSMNTCEIRITEVPVNNSIPFVSGQVLEVPQSIWQPPKLG